jgi:hypothetical protein
MKVSHLLGLVKFHWLPRPTRHHLELAVTWKWCVLACLGLQVENCLFGQLRTRLQLNHHQMEAFILGGTLLVTSHILAELQSGAVMVRVAPEALASNLLLGGQSGG